MNIKSLAELHSNKPFQVITLTIVLVLFIVTTFGPSAFDVHIDQVLAAPTWAHPLGTDSLGRDYLARLSLGTFNSLVITAFALILTLFMAVTYGFLAAVVSQQMQTAMLFLLDIYMSIPALALSIIVAVFFHEALPRTALSGFAAVVVALALGGWPIVARAVRAEFLRVSREVFVEASKALGASRKHLLFVQIWPHLRATITTLLLTQIPSKLLMENTLGLIGLGLPDPNPSLGRLLGESWGLLTTRPLLMLAPVAVIALIGITLFQRSSKV